MDNKQQLKETKELFKTFMEYADKAGREEFFLLFITNTLLEGTIKALEQDENFTLDEETYRAMFASVYTVIHDERAIQYKTKKTYLA